jgi:hypothetical protein
VAPEVTRPEFHASNRRSSPVSAALLHSRPQERCGTRRQGHHASVQASHARRHGCARWPVPIAQRPAAPRPQHQGGEVVEMVECGCRWPANVAPNHRAVANPTPSLVLPVAIQLDSTAQAILATTLRIPCALSWAGLAQFVDGERRPTARVVADWARGLGGAAGKSRLGEHHHAGCGGEGEEGGGGRREEGEGTGVRWEANRPAAGRPAKSPSSRLRWLLRPSCVPACLAPSVSECLACTGYSIVPANMGQ